MKKRKFQNGGDVDDKRRGLEVSAGEKVGFFERLRMGNIDDPKSEAYKRFGAGRGATVVRGNTEDDAVSLDETGGYGRAAVDEAAKRPEYKASTPAPQAQVSGVKDKGPEAPKKAPIVTKEQIKKAGFDNLRDYLNAQRGLKRRDKPTTKRYTDKKSDDDLAYRAPRMGDAGFMAKRMTPDEVKAESMRNKLNAVYGEGSFKKGGMVSSASKRADGCAKRGKTRGRMV
jgi:hypothetical protein